MNQLPDFESIEQLFPQWMCARAIVESHLPKDLHFQVRSYDSLEIRFDWAQQIIDLAPPEDRDTLFFRTRAACSKACAAIDIQQFHDLLDGPKKLPVNHGTLCIVDSLLARQAFDLTARRRATPCEILAHVMGIRPVWDIAR